MGNVNCCSSRPVPGSLKRNTLKNSRNNYGYKDVDQMDFAKLGADGECPLSIGNSCYKTSSSKKVSLEDFALLKVLGKGSFGKVLLVEKMDTGLLYAMKVLKKDVIIQRKQKVHMRAEREILETVDSPFILGLHYAFQTNDKLYLVMDFMSGGELFFHLRREKKFLESKTRFYAAEIILALEHLHSVGIIYRDLKPENILIGADGHIKIADFGLSKQGIEEGAKTYTFCGTPEYLAPEILQAKGHDKAVDYWSLGALIYEMLTGAPPFYSRDKQQMFRNILEKPLEIKPYFSAEAGSLLSSLLVVDPNKRLANVTELKAHPFFKGFDWEKAVKCQVKPPFIPKTSNDKDLKYFDKMFTEASVDETPSHGQMKGKSVESSYGYTFHGFTYEPEKSIREEETAEDIDFVKHEGNRKEYHKISP